VKRSRSFAVQTAICAVLLSAAFGVTAKAANEALQPLITTSELVVGQNRFAFGLAKGGKLIENAQVLVRLYNIDKTAAHLTFETNARYQAIQTLEIDGKVHRHADGTSHVHNVDNAVRGIYVTQLPFSHSGNWGVELVLQGPGETFESARATVVVRDRSSMPSVGEAVPRSRNMVASDVKDLREIDTSEHPDPRLHQIRIADAIAMKKPQLIVFATPQFCTSRMCGPVVDIVRTLLPGYANRIAFIHQEIWQDFASKKVFPTVEEWRLQSEPWVFVVDAQGVIRAKFEGLVTAREIETVLQSVLPPATAQRQ
jgi:hypothetical protein